MAGRDPVPLWKAINGVIDGLQLNLSHAREMDEINFSSDWTVRLDAMRRIRQSMTPEQLVREAESQWHWQHYMTPIERHLYGDIHRAGLPMLFQWPVGPYMLDFADPERKVAIEADGRRHHSPQRDMPRDQWLWDHEGWRVFRAWGDECKREMSVAEDMSRGGMRFEATNLLCNAIKAVVYDGKVKSDPRGRWDDARLELHRFAYFPLKGA